MKTARILFDRFAGADFARRAAPSSPRTKTPLLGRLLIGKVLDKQDNPVPNAVVYVTDTRTRAVKTYIVGADGNYRFPALVRQRGLRNLRAVEWQEQRHEKDESVR